MTYLIAVLLSLAMMLTGAGEGQVDEASRTLVLHDVSITFNGESVDLAPALRLGASTDGEKAVFDFGVDLNGEALMPIQLGVSEAGVSALLAKSDICVNVPAQAIETAMEQVNEAIGALTSQVETENPELLQFMTQEFIPAYTALLEAAQDEEFANRMQENGDAILDSVVDRGAGTPVTELVNGEDRELTEYSYTLGNDELLAMINAISESEEVVGNYYRALFKLYAMMPEESGLNQIQSFDDLFGMGVEMTLEVDEKRSDDGEIELDDMMMTIDLTNVLAAAVQEQDDAQPLPEIPPIVLDIQAEKVYGESAVTMTCDYEVDEVGLDMLVYAVDGIDSKNMLVNMAIQQEGQDLGSISVFGNQVELPEGGSRYSLTYDLDVADQLSMGLGIEGQSDAEGGCANRVSLYGEQADQSLDLSFSLDVVTDPIEDLVNGHEPTVVIDDLSDEGMNALGQDETVGAAMMQALGSLSMDAQKLMADESVQKLSTLGAPEEEDEDGDYDYTYEIEGFEVEDDDVADGDYDYDDYDYEEEEVVDDGVLPFEEPKLGWLPEGWKVVDSNVDTAYDWVDVSVADETGDNTVYAVFFDDSDSDQVNYIVSDNGRVEPVEGREITVSDFGDGSISVTLRHENVYANLMITTAETLDLDTLGKLISGIEF